jgi:glutamyl-tRNA synthetase
LHLGHARTFWIAYERAREHGGTLVFRNEDLDPQRSRPEYAHTMFDDLSWLGIEWQEGPDIGGPFAPYEQSKRHNFYLSAWKRLYDGGHIFPCTCSRRDLASAAQAPHEGLGDLNDEPMYHGRCRKQRVETSSPAGYNWRFRVPGGRGITFDDARQGPQRFVAGEEFGDFVVWRRDDVPAYQLAVVVDDAAMQITEVVRGADLLRSTARQLLLTEALGMTPPSYFHCDLVTDEHGVRLAKRHDALSLRALRAAGMSPEQMRALWQASGVQAR